MSKKQKNNTIQFSENMIFKSLLTGISMLLIWNINTTNNTDKSLNTFKAETELINNNILEKLNNFQEFIKVPRFTKNDFEAEIKPIIIQLNQNTTELNARSIFIEQTREKLLKLDFEIKNLK